MLHRRPETVRGFESSTPRQTTISSRPTVRSRTGTRRRFSRWLSASDRRRLGHVSTSFSSDGYIFLLSDRYDVRSAGLRSLKCIGVVHCLCTTRHGEMAERIKAAVPKTAVHPVHRRFESYSHRQKTNRGYGGTGRRNGLRRRGRKTCRFESCYPHHDMYHWLSWIEHRTTNAENGGSNPSWYATRRDCERPGADATYPNHLLGWIRNVPERRRATCRRTP